MREMHKSINAFGLSKQYLVSIYTVTVCWVRHSMFWLYSVCLWMSCFDTYQQNDALWVASGPPRSLSLRALLHVLTLLWSCYSTKKTKKQKKNRKRNQGQKLSTVLSEMSVVTFVAILNSFKSLIGQKHREVYYQLNFRFPCAADVILM